MSEHTLGRTGDVPLSFPGELIAEASSHEQEGMGQNRWHDLKLYRTGSGRYVLAIHFKSRYRGEGPRDTAIVCASATSVRDELSGYDPAPSGIGFPPGREYDEKQRRMVENLRFRFDRAVSELFEELGDEVTERID